MSVRKPQFVGERVPLNRLCTKGKSSLRQKDVVNDGPYCVYGASGIVGSMATFQNERPYVAVVKDGAGVGRVSLCAEKTSVLGTMQSLIPNEGVLAEYLLHLIRSMRLGEGFSGSTIPHIYFKDYGKCEVRVFSLEGQKQIVERLSVIESFINKLERLIEKTDLLVKSRFVEMFGDPIENPRKLDLMRIDQIASVQTGATPLRSEQRYFNGSIPWVKTGEIADDFVHGIEERITEAAIAETNCKVFPSGTILIAMYGQGDTRGKAAILPVDASTNQACAAILLKDGFDKNFILAQLRLRYEDLRSLSLGGNQKNLSLKIIKSYELMIPPFKQQQDFMAFVAQVDKPRFVAHGGSYLVQENRHLPRGSSVSPSFSKACFMS